MILLSRQCYVGYVCMLPDTLVCVSAPETSVLLAIRMHSLFYTALVGQ
jgi:hypothetical protein